MAGGKRPEEVAREMVAAHYVNPSTNRENVLIAEITRALRQIRRDTIEECARVAEAYEDGQDKVVRARAITTAIRNLKD